MPLSLRVFVLAVTADTVRCGYTGETDFSSFFTSTKRNSHLLASAARVYSFFMLIDPNRPLPPEPWVDILTVCRHLDFSRSKVKQMVDCGVIPSFGQRNGKKTYLRFKLSLVDAALMRASEGSTHLTNRRAPLS